MKKLHITILLFATCMISLSCQKDIKYQQNINDISFSENNETSRNLIVAENADNSWAKGKYLVQYQNWIYYSNSEDHNSLYKKKLDSSETKKLNDRLSYCLNISGNWIFYTSNDNLYKIKTDGSDNENICEDAVLDLCYYDGYIYYSNEKGLFKIKPDGGKSIRLLKTNITDIIVSNGWVYYNEGGEKYGRINLDGTNNQILSKDTISETIIDRDWIYFQDIKRKKFCKMKIDGTEVQTIIPDNGHDYHILGEYIYYCAGNHIYRMKKDGSEQMIFREIEGLTTFSILEKALYYEYTTGSRLNQDLEFHMKLEMLE